MSYRPGANIYALKLPILLTPNRIGRHGTVTPSQANTPVDALTVTGRGVVTYVYVGRSTGSSGHVWFNLVLDGSDYLNAFYTPTFHGTVHPVPLALFNNSLVLRVQNNDGSTVVAYFVCLNLYSDRLRLSRQTAREYDDRHIERYEEYSDDSGNVIHTVKWIDLKPDIKARIWGVQS